MSGNMSSRGSTAPAPKPKAGPVKRWLKRILLALAAFLLLTLVFAAWVFNTEAGARFAFRFLPSELTVGGISGTFASSLNVNKLAFKLRRFGGSCFRIKSRLMTWGWMVCA